MTNMTSRAVTIVIPIYGDLPSLQRSISSVLDNVDLTIHHLLLINDCGPDADSIEASVLSMIAGLNNVDYERNERNLGFVLTCNLAVHELDHSGNDVLLLNSDARLTPGALDEMLRVLDLNEKHGVVFPRSNNASIASVPLLPLEGLRPDEAESMAIYEQLKNEIPAYWVTPIAVGFCFLVRRQLIDNYGFFDETYSPGYSEENDFCLRVNKFGYSSVIANRAFAYHEGSMSFEGSYRDLLKKKNERTMVERYTFYHSAVAHYFQYAVDPVDWFADRIYGSGTRRVLIDLYHMSLIYNGSTRNALSFLELLSERRAYLDFEFVIVSSAEAIEFFDLRSYGFTVIRNGSLDGTFDLGFALSPVSASSQVYILNRHCLRWVVSHFDVIALRIYSLLEVSYARRQIVLDSLTYANRVIPISEAALDDIEGYFGPEADGIRVHSTVIHEGVAEATFSSLEGSTEVSPRDDGYVLVIGNVFIHKQFPEALAAIADLDRRVVAFGAFAQRPTLGANVEFVEGGLLSDDEVDRLYRQAACVVFPSSYEGFGLPIAETAQRGRPLVIFDTTVGREVVDSLGVSDRTTFFTRFSQLPALIEAAIAHDPTTPVPNLRPLRAYNEGILDVLLAVLGEPVDIPALRLRMSRLRAAEIYSDVAEDRLRMASATLNSRTVRMALGVAERLAPVRPALRLAYRAVHWARRRGNARPAD